MIGRMAEIYPFTSITISGGIAVSYGAGIGHLVHQRLGQINKINAASRKCTLLIFSRIPSLDKIDIWGL